MDQHHAHDLPCYIKDKTNSKPNTRSQRPVGLEIQLHEFPLHLVLENAFSKCDQIPTSDKVLRAIQELPIAVSKFTHKPTSPERRILITSRATFSLSGSQEGPLS